MNTGLCHSHSDLMTWKAVGSRVGRHECRVETLDRGEIHIPGKTEQRGTA